MIVPKSKSLNDLALAAKPCICIAVGCTDSSGYGKLKVALSNYPRFPFSCHFVP